MSPVGDAPTIGGSDTASVTEDLDPDRDGLLQATGALNIVDPDAGESAFVAETIAGSHGSLFIDAAGIWRYSASNGQAAIQALDAGEVLSDVLNVTTADGTTHAVSIAINGTEDAPVVSGTTSAAVTKGGVISAGGVLTISDIDAADNPIAFVNEAGAVGDNGYGLFAITDGTWQYTLDEDHAAVQALAAGEGLTDTDTFVASDGSTQAVTVSIASTAVSVPPPVVESPAPNTADPIEGPKVEPVEVFEKAETPEQISQDEVTETVTTEDTGEVNANDSPPTAIAEPGAVPPPLQPDEVVLSVLADAQGNDGPTVKQTPTAAAKPTVVAAQTFLQELKSFWQPEAGAVKGVELSEVRFGRDFWTGLDKMGHDLDDSRRQQEARMQLSTEAAAGVGVSLTAGFVSWALRAGSMAASLLAAMPTWRNFDPMPVLSSEDGDEHEGGGFEADSDFRPNIGEQDSHVDELFERQE